MFSITVYSCTGNSFSFDLSFDYWRIVDFYEVSLIINRNPDDGFLTSRILSFSLFNFYFSKIMDRLKLRCGLLSAGKYTNFFFCYFSREIVCKNEKKMAK